MAFRLRVKNFQSIEDASLDVDGLTVVTGPNNSGKTAMIRAVYGAFTNARGNKYVRYGKDSCEVRLDFSDGRTLVWEKGAKVNRYQLDGKDLNKVGQGAPPEVSTLGVLPVEAAGREIWPQFAHQFVGQVFLIDEPGSVLAEAVSDVNRVGVLNEALRNAQSDRRTAASDLKLRQEDAAKHEAVVAKYDGLDGALSLAREVETLRSDLAKDRARLDEAKRLRDRLRAAESEVAKLAPVRSLGSVEDASLQKATKAESALGWVRSASARLAAALKTRQSASEAVEAVRATAIPDLDVSALVRQLDAALSVRQTARSATSTVAAVRREAGDVERELSEARTVLSSVLEEAGVCPTCGSETHDEGIAHD